MSLQVGRLLWHCLRRACLSDILALRDCAPADKEAIVVCVDDFLLLQDKDAVNRLDLFLFVVELVTHSLDRRGRLLRLLFDLSIVNLSSSCLHALHRHISKHQAFSCRWLGIRASHLLVTDAFLDLALLANAMRQINLAFLVFFEEVEGLLGLLVQVLDHLGDAVERLHLQVLDLVLDFGPLLDYALILLRVVEFVTDYLVDVAEYAILEIGRCH